MGKSTGKASNRSANKSFNETQASLQSDPETLRGMLVALNDFVERFRAEFAENSLGACLEFGCLLQDIQGKHSETHSTAALSVKPDFFVAAKYLDLDAVGHRFKSLQDAVEAAQADVVGHEQRAPIFWDKDAEIEHYQIQQQSASDTIRKMNECISDFLDIFTRERDRVAEALTISGNWSRPRSPDDWSKIFQLSWDTLKNLFELQKLRNIKLTSKLYRVHLDDLHDGYQD